MGARIDMAKIPMLPVFKWLAREGGIAQNEMLRTFNCGIGVIAVAAAPDADRVTAAFQQAGEAVITVGAITASGGVNFSGSLDLA
jgi:phosphoribosylformylglycinamidine cyclo-ligase